MARPVRKKSRNKKSVYALTILLVLLAAVGAGLYRLPPSLLDVGIIYRLAANKFSSPSADKTSAEAVLRGAVYDRNMAELAVSYRLYTLYVRPSEMTDTRKVVNTLSGYAGLGESELEIRLQSGGNLVKIADNLEKEQVEEIAELDLTGVFWKPVEERFYPENSLAAELIGYAEKGIGLAGIEGSLDTVLQQGQFQASSIPEIDFRGINVLGKSRLDVILTMDLKVQKAVEKKLHQYLQAKGATRGQAIVMNARTGAVLAWADSPSFNPNYFWQNPDSKYVSTAPEKMDFDLFRDMLARAAAVRQLGESGGSLLPETVASPDYGLQEEEIRKFADVLGFGESYSCRLPSCIQEENKTGSGNGREESNTLDFVTAAAGMLNGGWHVEPYVLDSIYDETRETRYTRSTENFATVSRRTMSPSMGIAMRMNFPRDRAAQEQNILVHESSVNKIVRAGTLSRYVLQDMMIGAIPARVPEIVMLMVTWQDTLYPLSPARKTDGHESMLSLGKEILPDILKIAVAEPKGLAPKGFDVANFNRFLISRRIDFQNQRAVPEKRNPVMPLVTGLSLRKGLQRLNAYNITVRVEGSGRIVGQQPEKGKSLNGVEECTLILESRI